MSTAASWISKKVGRCGGDACIRDTRITVWGLVSQRRLGMSDKEILALRLLRSRGWHGRLQLDFQPRVPMPLANHLLSVLGVTGFVE